ncbi:hypothetical protein [Chitinophaga sp.]|uniref:hypothetical protein n=1 Tax=Chitinophaga sp. TaxID=1869181 RepID=UPI002C33E6FC|nr:hypothetical protein [Chitinophaga sp.]HWV64355.1 hypothetical protein [Chitinophaga sp.]
MITIISQPDKFTPAHNPVCFSISSDNYAQPGFYYVVDVYNSNGQILVTQKFQPPVVGTDPIDIELHMILQELVAPNYCRLNQVVSPALVETGAGMIASYTVKFGEQYGGTVYANLINTSGYVFNASINYLRFAFYNSTSYLNNRFLTNFPAQTARKKDSVMLSILQSEDAAITGFNVEIFNLAGNSIYTDTINNPYNSLDQTSNRALHLHVGFDYLYSQLAFSSTIYNLAAYYTITPEGGQPQRVNLYSQCERFPGKRLYFLNELGGFDGFNFMLASQQSQTTERNTYQRQPSNKKTGYDPASRRFETTTRNYSTSYTEKIKVISDYLSDTESQMLADLMSSPLIYMEADAGDYGGAAGQLILIPVDTKVNDYTIKKTRTDKLFNLELDLELNYKNFRQVV